MSNFFFKPLKILKSKEIDFVVDIDIENKNRYQQILLKLLFGK